jgi:hypothetical protein
LFPPWLWKVGHVLNLDLKNHGPGVLGALKLGGEGTTQPAGTRLEGTDSMSVTFPLSYHLETSRVFVPCALPARTHDAGRPRPASCRLSPHIWARVYHRYFEQAKPGSAEIAWKEQSGIKMDLDMAGAGIIETTFSATTWGEQLKPLALLAGILQP